MEKGNEIILNKYTFLEKIGKGSFGEVFKGIIIKTNKIIAIKTENIQKLGVSPLKNETIILNYLNREKCKNIPLVYWYGIYKTTKKCLIIPYYNSSLHNIFFNIREKNETEKQKITYIFFVFKSLLNIIQYIHEKKVIHRDIKPDNFMYHDGEFYLIDFGIASFFESNNNFLEESKDKNTDVYENCSIIGTPNYISIFVHKGKKPEPIDDLISLGYVFYYFVCFLLNRNMEWQIDKGSDTKTILENKMKMKIQHIKREFGCDEKITKIIHLYLKKCYKFSFEKKIKYLILKEIFTHLQS